LLGYGGEGWAALPIEFSIFLSESSSLLFHVND
jgi:hypothetical protein